MANMDNDVRFRYLNQEILTASREKLLLITYDIAIGSCKKAVNAIEEQDAEEANSRIQIAQRALRELQFALRPEKAEDLTNELNRLYDFMYNQLVTANLNKDQEKILSVISLLEDLLESWKEAFEKLSQEDALSGKENQGSTPRELVGGGLNISC